MNFEQYGVYVAYAVVCMACMVILKYVLNAKVSGHYVADEELAAGNIAVGLRRGGAHLGLAIAMMGVLSGESATTIINDLLLTFAYGLVAIAFMFSSLVLTDKVVLPHVDNVLQVKNGNVAVGFVEFGMLVATGIIAYSSIAGDAGASLESPLLAALSSLSYFVLGQVSLVTLVLVYQKVITRKYNVVEGVNQGKEASGIYLSGKLIAYALILKSAIFGNGSDMAITQMLLEFFMLAISGMIMLYVFELVADKLIVTSTSVAQMLADNKVATTLQLVAVKIGLALILSNSIL